MDFKHCFVLSFILFLTVFSCKKDKPFDLPSDGLITHTHDPAHLVGEETGRVYTNLDELAGLKNKLLVELQAVQSDASVYEGLLYGPVIESDNPSTGGKFYMIYWEAFGGSLYKLFVETDQNGDPIKSNVFEFDFDEVFLQAYYRRETDLPHMKGKVKVMTIQRFFEKRNGEQGNGVDPCIQDCISIVFGDNNGTGGGGTSGSPSGGTPDDTPSIEIPPGCELFVEIKCGCPPGHPGGTANPVCNCKDPDVLVWKLVCQFSPDDQTGDRSGGDFWDCVDILNEFGLITDHDLFLQRLQECQGYLDPYDYGPNNPSGVHPDFLFCEQWQPYLEDCMNGGMMYKQTIDSWAELLWKNESAFNCLVQNDDGCSGGNEVMPDHTEYINGVSALPCLTEKQKCDFIVNPDPAGIVLFEDLQPVIAFDDGELCWLWDNNEIVNDLKEYNDNNPSTPSIILRKAVQFLEFSPDLELEIAILLAEADEELGEYDIEDDMPSTTGWLSCESFEFESFGDIHSSGVDALFFSWYVPSVANFKTVGPFNMDVNITSGCSNDDAAWCSAWAANRAGKIVGLLAAGEPTHSDLVIKNAFRATFLQGLLKNTPFKCQPILNASAFLASNNPSRSIAIYYTSFAQWLVHCGF